MKAIFNDQYEYPIEFARESYNGKDGYKSFTISLKYSNNKEEELEQFFKSTIINNIKIINSEEKELYSTNVLILLNQMYININNNSDNTRINLEFVERVDDII